MANPHQRRPNGREHHIGAVHIDGNSFYNQVTAMGQTLIRIEAELKAANESRDRYEKDNDEEIDKIDKRITTLEPRVWAFPSLSALIGIGALVVSLYAAMGG